MGLRLLIDGFGVTDHLRGSVRAALSSVLAAHEGEDLSVVLMRLHNGEWTVFIADSANLELLDGDLVERIRAVLKRAEIRVADPLGEDDRRVLAAIARAHGHGPRRPIALIDVAWAELGSEPAAREALQRLLLLGFVELLAAGATPELLGRLTERGVEAVRKG